jgi:ketosteroid isomerase-like protein
MNEFTLQEQVAERLQIESRLYDYWHDVDTNWGRNAASYYTENGIFGGKAATYTGRREIAAFYQYRIDRGVERVAVHQVSNLRIQFVGRTRAESTWYMMGYAADGVPVLPTHAPIQIALVTDVYEKQDDGIWLCAHRNFEILFAGGTKPTNHKVDVAGQGKQE